MSRVSLAHRKRPNQPFPSCLARDCFKFCVGRETHEPIPSVPFLHRAGLGRLYMQPIKHVLGDATLRDGLYTLKESVHGTLTTHSLRPLRQEKKCFSFASKKSRGCTLRRSGFLFLHLHGLCKSKLETKQREYLSSGFQRHKSMILLSASILFLGR